jgi:hypothetical protein
MADQLAFNSSFCYECGTLTNGRMFCTFCTEKRLLLCNKYIFLIHQIERVLNLRDFDRQIAHWTSIGLIDIVAFLRVGREQCRKLKGLDTNEGHFYAMERYIAGLMSYRYRMEVPHDVVIIDLKVDGNCMYRVHGNTRYVESYIPHLPYAEIKDALSSLERYFHEDACRQPNVDVHVFFECYSRYMSYPT